MTRLVAFGAAVALIAVAAFATAHGAPPPRDMDTRVLHDHNDDCGGDAVTVNCRGTHDLIALDVREAWREGLGDVLIFRFIMDVGDEGTLVDTLTFRGGGKEHSLTLRTTNDNTFSGSFDHVGGKTSINDGTRFAVEGTVRLATLGLSAGDTLSQFRVEASRDGTAGDYMPGGYHGAVGDVDNPPQGSDPTNYVRPELKLKGPTHYARLSFDPDSATIAPGDELLVSMDIQNRLGKTPQRFDFTLRADDGVEARFHDPNGGASGYASTYRLELQKGASGSAHLAVRGLTGGTTGSVTITMTSDLGARVEQTFAFGVGAAPPDPTPTPTPTKDKDSPAPALPVVAFATVLSLALLRRRR